jgi:cytidine kinase
MSLLVTGSIGIDTVKTPHGVSEECIGGSAIYFSMASSFFSPVRFIGVVGDDCPFDLETVFNGKDVDLTGLEIRKGSKTFRWQGSYEGAMNEANTDDVQLNVLAETPPAVPDVFRDSKYVFLANTHPALQQQLLSQIDSPEFVAADTMNLWIENEREHLAELLKKIDCLILNDGEARLLTDCHNSTEAAFEILEMGPAVVVIKKGEFGAMAVEKGGHIFMLPAFPSRNVKDPTGAGDSFAGGMMGYVAASGKKDLKTLATAMAYGTVVASFTIEGFSLESIKMVTKLDINSRFEKLREYTNF